MNVMKISYLFLASAALLATACNAEKGAANSSGPEVTAAAGARAQQRRLVDRSSARPPRAAS